MLAALLKSPSGLAPESRLDDLKGRWQYVLDGMVEQGWITKRQAANADFPKIKKQKAKDRLGGQTGFLLAMVEQQMADLGFDEQEIQRGGLRIVSTFDKQAQRAAVQAVRKVGPSTDTEGLRIGLAGHGAPLLGAHLHRHLVRERRAGSGRHALREDQGAAQFTPRTGAAPLIPARRNLQARAIGGRVQDLALLGPLLVRLEPGPHHRLRTGPDSRDRDSDTQQHHNKDPPGRRGSRPGGIRGFPAGDHAGQCPRSDSNSVPTI
mgnify:CR=1 FL=1